MIKTIKEYLLFRKFLKYNNVDIFNINEKWELYNFNKEILEKIKNSSLNNLSKLIISEDISSEYARWYKQCLGHLLTYFKKYNTEEDEK